MKTNNTAVIALSLAISFAALGQASAQTMSCYTASGMTYCNGSPAGPAFGDSFARGYLGGLNVASHYAMVNAYREAHGLPRCHYGLSGALKSAADGRPMC
jgi:hypothetical protein